MPAKPPPEMAKPAPPPMRMRQSNSGIEWDADQPPPPAAKHYGLFEMVSFWVFIAAFMFAMAALLFGVGIRP